MWLEQRAEGWVGLEGCRISEGHSFKDSSSGGALILIPK